MSILVNLYKWGNAQGVLIPREVLKEIGIDDLQNAKLVLDVKDNAIILKKESLEFGDEVQESVEEYLVDGE
ncbi:AbrB/MazE/SpoVT family DNA-binding domain-containing protein [Ligilactobacillus aviarius]|uniref:AbrB/MazE/SpoVT family DNA-binding domain-containing protein n=1 Tax=Ligilactobacillus aviarius TaxID=1606 RepID=UPI0019572F4E|nr:AbrB/MazE/SpoVT family DNA-binding domain-containing protein [Ligilactobacillus aviarius]MBM6862781.1 AbrB/MazE/SpoVT family DNA-binding domain-containing protein [Ligilactobacillus aviarius]